MPYKDTMTWIGEPDLYISVEKKLRAMSYEL